MEAKHFWVSKTFWVNIVAIVAILSQYFTGQEVLDVEAQAVLLAVINLILRLLTNKPVSW